MAKTQICTVQSLFPCDYTHTRAHKQKLVLSADSNERQAPRGCSVDGSFWISCWFAWWSQDTE